MSLILTTVLAASTLTVLQDPAAPQGHSGWVTDWVAAKTEAKEGGKDLLIDFTGSDWCSWCKSLKAEVFDQDEFKAQAPESFVLVELDFPNDRSGQSEELQEQNRQLQAQFGPGGFPTIYLADEEGRPYAQTGYQKGGAVPYLEHLAELRAIREQRDTLWTEAQSAEGVAKAQLIADALEVVPADLHKHYLGWIDQIIALDADGAGALREKFERMKRSMALEAKVAKVKDAMREAAQGEDWGGAGKVIEDLLAADGEDLDVTIKHELCYYRGVFAVQEGKLDLAIKTLQATKKIAPEHPMNQRIDQIIEQLEQQQEGGGGP